MPDQRLHRLVRDAMLADGLVRPMTAESLATRLIERLGLSIAVQLRGVPGAVHHPAMSMDAHGDVRDGQGNVLSSEALEFLGWTRVETLIGTLPEEPEEPEATTEPVCVNCGNDAPAEGHDLCTDCLEETT